MVNKFISDSVHQGQGDPISPVLFNLAFDPLLRTVLADPLFTGFSLHKPQGSFPMVFPAPIKVLGYADDALFFLSNFRDFHQLQTTLSLYSRASYAKVNFHKTEAISLTGARQVEWEELLRSADITAWHDYRSLSAVRYLGYPLASTASQLNVFLDGLLVKIKTACDIHLQRGLSVQGRSTVVNTLILSKIWHVLRVTPVPLSFHKQIRSLITRFITYKMLPPVRYNILTLPKL